MGRDKMVYWGSTGLISLMMLASAGMYLANYEEVSKVFVALGFPVFIIYPLAVAKILGAIAIVSRKVELLKNLAYAGFFYDFVLAAAAHLNAGDGEALPAFVALILLGISYFSEKRVFGKG